MNLLWLLSDNGTHVRFCWIPSHCGTEGNERVDQLATETLVTIRSGQNVKQTSDGYDSES